MNRQPEYHKTNENIRVIYRPHNRWVLQELSGRKPSRELDKWDDISPEQPTKDAAVLVMYTRYPLPK